MTAKKNRLEKFELGLLREQSKKFRTSQLQGIYAKSNEKRVQIGERVSLEAR